MSIISNKLKLYFTDEYLFQFLNFLIFEEEQFHQISRNFIIPPLLKLITYFNILPTFIQVFVNCKLLNFVKQKIMYLYTPKQELPDK